jgi:hypothetical protein
VQILSLRQHLKCDNCGGRNVDVRPHWNERSPRPSLTIANYLGAGMARSQ